MKNGITHSLACIVYKAGHLLFIPGPSQDKPLPWGRMLSSCLHPPGNHRPVLFGENPCTHFCTNKEKEGVVFGDFKLSPLYKNMHADKNQYQAIQAHSLRSTNVSSKQHSPDLCSVLKIANMCFVDMKLFSTSLIFRLSRGSIYFFSFSLNKTKKQNKKVK